MERTRRRTLKAAGSIAAGLSVAGCFGNDSGGGNGNENGNGNATLGSGLGSETGTGTAGSGDGDLRGSVGPTPNYLKLTEHSTNTSGDDVGVTGTVRNTGDQPLNDVEVEVTLRDGDTLIGEFVDTNEEEAEALRPGKTWQFDVVFEDEKLGQATGYTISADADVAQEADA